jgi:hypothetical protein
MNTSICYSLACFRFTVPEKVIIPSPTKTDTVVIPLSKSLYQQTPGPWPSFSTYEIMFSCSLIGMTMIFSWASVPYFGFKLFQYSVVSDDMTISKTGSPTSYRKVSPIISVNFKTSFSAEGETPCSVASVFVPFSWQEQKMNMARKNRKSVCFIFLLFNGLNIKSWRFSPKGLLRSKITMIYRKITSPPPRPASCP